jgi:hypothetical protein
LLSPQTAAKSYFIELGVIAPDFYANKKGRSIERPCLINQNPEIFTQSSQNVEQTSAQKYQSLLLIKAWRKSWVKTYELVV